MSISVIILNWNGSAMLRKYLPSVVACTPDAEIIVADNGSTDDSLPIRSSPERRCSSRTFRYGYLVTT